MKTPLESIQRDAYYDESSGYVRNMSGSLVKITDHDLTDLDKLGFIKKTMKRTFLRLKELECYYLIERLENEENKEKLKNYEKK